MYCYNSEIKFNLFKFVYSRLLICLSHFNMLVTNSNLPWQIFFKFYMIVRNGGMRVCMLFFDNFHFCVLWDFIPWKYVAR
jgi:hypothetical protein